MFQRNIWRIPIFSHAFSFRRVSPRSVTFSWPLVPARLARGAVAVTLANPYTLWNNSPDDRSRKLGVCCRPYPRTCTAIRRALRTPISSLQRAKRFYIAGIHREINRYGPINCPAQEVNSPTQAVAIRLARVMQERSKAVPMPFPWWSECTQRISMCTGFSEATAS